LLALLGGCAAIDDKVISDEKLARKAAISLNVQDNEVTISDRRSEGMNMLTFTATTKQGSSHRCHIYTSLFGLSQTAAICAGGTCDASLKAMGAC